MCLLLGSNRPHKMRPENCCKGKGSWTVGLSCRCGLDEWWLALPVRQLGMLPYPHKMRPEKCSITSPLLPVHQLSIMIQPGRHNCQPPLTHNLRPALKKQPVALSRSRPNNSPRKLEIILRGSFHGFGDFVFIQIQRFEFLSHLVAAHKNFGRKLKSKFSLTSPGKMLLTLSKIKCCLLLFFKSPNSTPV